MGAGKGLDAGKASLPPPSTCLLEKATIPPFSGSAPTTLGHGQWPLSWPIRFTLLEFEIET